MHVLFCLIALGAAPPSGFLRELPGAGWSKMEMGSFALSPDGARVTVAAEGIARRTYETQGEVRRYDITTGKVERSWELGKRDPRCLMLSLDGKKVIAFSRSDEILTWGQDDETPRVVCKSPSAGRWSQAVLLPDGKSAAVSSGFEAAIVSLETGAVKQFKIPTDVQFAGVISPDGRLFASPDGEDLDIWEASSGKRIRSFLDHRGGVCGPSFQPGGSLVSCLASWNVDELQKRTFAHIHDLKTDKRPLSVEVHPGLQYGWTAFSSTGMLAVLGTTDTQGEGYLRVYSVKTGGELARVDFDKRDGWPVGVAFSRDGMTLVAGLLRRIKAFRVEGRP